MYPCFLIVPTSQAYREALTTQPGQCPIYGDYHRGVVVFEEFEYDPEQEFPKRNLEFDKAPFPARCECGFSFTSERSNSLSCGHRLIRKDTGETQRHIHQFGTGAMWRATWYKNDTTGLYGWDWDNATEAPLIVRTPGGDWNIDGRASNCTMPNDKTHRCWVRHGEPPNIHVDKNGHTCGAGAGSIIAGNYHGFLHNGQLTANL
jgi:hypothetical protein